MKTKFHRLFAASLFALAVPVLHAQTSMVPDAMNYQGMLTDAQGNPVAPAAPENRNVEFRIYDAAAGGNLLWGEAQTVTVFKGNFSVILGNGTALGGDTPSQSSGLATVFANAASANLFFGITPQGGAEFAPRQKLLSSAYALRARVAEKVSQTSGESRFNWVFANNLTMQGHTKIEGGNVLEFGVNDPTRARNTATGQIGYQTFSNGLDIVGAGADVPNRRLTLWAEGGTEMKGPLTFSPGFRQNISMWDGNNGFGVQSGGVLFSRSFDSFTWNKATSGQPLNTTTHPTGPGENGTELAKLSPAGFVLNTGVFTGNGSGLTNINPNSLPNNYNYLGINGGNVIEFGRGISKGQDNGSIGYGTFSGGAALDIIGAGPTQAARRINMFAAGGLTVSGPTTISGDLNMQGTISQNGHRQWLSSFTNHAIGSQDWTTYFRTGAGGSNTQGSFAWYRGGSHTNAERNAGGGSALAYLDAAGLKLQGERAAGIAIELGHGVAGKDVSAGIIGYKKFSEGLDIVGAGTAGNNRLVTIYAEGGTSFTGPIILQNAQRFPNFGFGFDADTLSNNGVQATNGQSSGDVVLNALGGRIVADRFTATSDARIKNVLALSSGVQDLATLMKVQITDYTKKDDPAKQPAVHKKVIAQQVEEIFPQAVSRAEGPVPDLMTSATAKAGFVPLDGKVLARVKQGDVLKVWSGNSPGGGPEVKLTKVSSVTKEGVQLEDKLDGELFIYGHQVDDLRSVDYEAIAMLNVSATQELARQLKAQTEELAAVKAERDALADEVTGLRATTSVQESRLSTIEARIEALARPDTQPVSLQVKAGAN